MGSHEPVLRVRPGDTVRTSTVDTWGYDSVGRLATPSVRGNWLTGPFFIEGAAPGDTLLVRLDHLWPNRPSGFTGTGIALHLLEPSCDVAIDDVRGGGQWKLDLSTGQATLVEPRLKIDGLTFPIRPMVGCLGVAPPDGQAISAVTSGPYGGNMDYNGLVAGVTLHFPVFVDGALFFVGDGHALQGDGEIIANGIEVSFDVTFTVDLARGKRIGWPRGENADFILTFGNARPLERAMQHATTEMVAWLTREHGLDLQDAHFLMGMYVRYEVGNVVDPAYTMVCKFPKSELVRLGLEPSDALAMRG